ncbi:Dual specificity phosphatase, catalytic domain protein [Cordyceps fumosorosea ARSEF 2679]|uniref:protein-tyrosine-phosphatase n=1 Tax=Cordyceps fumosorosea (strain ARSEF 2679) TaxID=1081104 RepID=A0A162MXH8_CORFA|nr:Dual specificity phosphatase, catalytic domain protein [Cordyceps fumosorosea ARSEF 2679]OAA72209.1 Dual specificity phosphatase, catalytic domain protein [Cordyceps fumosorosea ARSEF 2679]
MSTPDRPDLSARLAPEPQAQARARAYAAPEASISEIRPHLFIGNIYSSYRREALEPNHITAILSILDARHALWSSQRVRRLVPEENHLYVPCLDNSTMNLLPFMARVCDFIDKHATAGADSNVLVHCQAGVSRSAAVVVAYLMRRDGMALDDAIEAVRERRRVRPNANFMDQLRVWEAVGYQIWQDEQGAVPKDAYRAFLDKRAALLESMGLTGDEPIGMPGL